MFDRRAAQPNAIDQIEYDFPDPPAGEHWDRKEHRTYLLDETMYVLALPSSQRAIGYQPPGKDDVPGLLAFEKRRHARQYQTVFGRTTGRHAAIRCRKFGEIARQAGSLRMPLYVKMSNERILRINKIGPLRRSRVEK